MSSLYMPVTSLFQRAAETGERTSEHFYITITQGFQNYLSNAKDQVDKYSGGKGYTQGNSSTNSTSMKTAK
jgi:hypothetical protein